MTQPTAPPSEVSKFHANSDVDASVNSQHHTLGIQQNQAASGAHVHDGKNSKKLGKGKDLTFPTTAAGAYVQADFQKVINALRALGWGT